MTTPSEPRRFTLKQAIQAQQALRAAAGLEPELFPVEAFVGMISDEVEALRKAGMTDDQIVQTIEQNGGIAITSEELSSNYAPPELRHPHGDQ